MESRANESSPVRQRFREYYIHVRSISVYSVYEELVLVLLSMAPGACGGADGESSKGFCASEDVEEPGEDGK